MKDKKLDEKSLEELVKAANAIRDFFTKLGDEISKALSNIKAHKEEDTWEMKCPYKDRDEYWFIKDFGDVFIDSWDGCEIDMGRFNTGNVFPTKEAAELEAKRRNLLTRFKSFRDECNGNWKINWDAVDQGKFIIKCGNDKKLYVVSYWTVNEFNVFGYFKDYEDAKRAIELFGDEIKELFVECE